MRFVIAATPAGIVAAILLAACGGSESPPPEAGPAPPQPAAPAPSGDAPAEPDPADPEPAAPAPAPAQPAVEPIAELAPGRSTVGVELSDGTTVDVTFVVPDGTRPGEQRPLLLALPPGGQGQQEVDVGLDAYWAAEAAARGWLVASPVAPGGQLFFDGSERLVPELLARITAAYPTPEGRVAISGISNGGKSAFRIATLYPDLVSSLVVLPGFPDGADDARLPALVEAGVPVTIYVGEEDAGWIEESQQAETDIAELGGTVTLTVVPGAGHILRELDATTLFDALEAAPGRRYDGGPAEEAGASGSPY